LREAPVAKAAWRPAPSYDITTVAGLVDVLGGERSVAAELDVDAGEPRRWTLTGHIPPGWHLRLFAKILLLKRSVAPAVFGFPDDYTDWQALEAAAALYREGVQHG
jgi:hypothetical protein